jgi:hypothetical protein
MNMILTEEAPMKKNTLTILFVLFCCGLVQAQEQEDLGESKEYKALKGRTNAPAAADIDKSITVDALLAKNTEKDWSNSKAAVVEGYVMQVEKEEDGDYHIVLTSNAGETDTKKWMIVEVTSAWQKKSPGLSGKSLRDLYGKKVRVTGWLLYEPDPSQPDPRGTRWEIHPVTSIEII